MKKILILALFIIGISTYGQVPTDYYTQGYNTGCNLGKEANKKLYQKTVNNINFPLEYRNGVKEGYFICYKPIKLIRGEISDFVKCHIYNDEKACKKIEGSIGEIEK